MLASTWYKDSGIPVVFLHGFLGAQDDWAQIIELLQNFPQIRPLVVDLPGHGESQQIHCVDFNQCRKLLDETFQNRIGKQPFYLVGYSLGGRLALDYAVNANNPNIAGIFLEGANIGLDSPTEKQARWQNDMHWAERFRQEPLFQVLQDWYQQTVFADLTKESRQALIHRRALNDGQSLAQMLSATSLAKQPFYSPERIAALAVNTIFVVGEQDGKFRQMVEQYQLPYRLIENAGHNTHLANPQGFVKQLLQFISE